MKKSHLVFGILALVAVTTGVVYTAKWVLAGSHENLPRGYDPVLVENELSEPVLTAEESIEKNLRAFLSATTVEERLHYVSIPFDEKTSLKSYYVERGLSDSPLWKIERIESLELAGGRLWFVIYRDLQRKQHSVSFQKLDGRYLIHWSAMKAYCEVPWQRFIVDRPSKPVLMRGYLRQYEGVWPVGLPRDKYRCFLIEDRGKLFSKLAVMEKGAPGAEALNKLPDSISHPITVRMKYNSELLNQNVIQITELKHLRWQQLNSDPRFQGQ
ncbi:hypothetical protein NT6N_10860 [Oceaniferula spumae]|uniref:Outer membrane lipoprotein-sorting protein n=1 Tax=Oceaniferula spumae TaxID=2979115 RepID=A0AAT9FJB3_9BACT